MALNSDEIAGNSGAEIPESPGSHSMTPSLSIGDDAGVAEEGVRQGVPPSGQSGISLQNEDQGSPSREHLSSPVTATKTSTLPAPVERIISDALQDHNLVQDTPDDLQDVPDEGCRAHQYGSTPHSAQFSGISGRSLTPDSSQTPVARLRELFRKLHVNCEGLATEGGLYMHVRELLERRAGARLKVELCELLSEVVRRRFSDVTLGLQVGRVGCDEWVHHMMLRGAAPSHVSMECLNRSLRVAIRKDHSMLARMLEAFDQCDAAAHCDGRLRHESWGKAFALAKVPTPATPDLDGDNALDYFEFASHAVGATQSRVELALYDLSNGAMKWVPSKLLVGHHIEGIWHTGVRVFGKEYWYGGSVFECDAKQVPFEGPAQVLGLGTTLRNREELVDFIQKDLTSTFNTASYDVLMNNCNSFSDELTQFLLNGKQIPEWIRLQPQWARNATITHILRPALNKWLGGFGSKSAVGHHPIDDVTEEWRNRIAEGDIVLFRRYFTDSPQVARIVSLTRVAANVRLASLVMIRPTGARSDMGAAAYGQLGQLWQWDIVRLDNVASRYLYPCLKEAQMGASPLNVAMAIDTPASLVLSRGVSAMPEPHCPRSHIMEKEGHHPTAWLSSKHRSICGVCGGAVHHDGLVCRRCDYHMCQRCASEGSSLKGGGLFADLLTVDLVKELLDNEQFLTFKAEAYFAKADFDASSSIDRLEWHSLLARLYAELGLPQPTSGHAKETLSQAKDVQTFRGFFRSSLERSTRTKGLVAFRKPGKDVD
eukprot:CAMPEP_0178373802 /NCGR_PEP_ID=MMETSP0689_2-20121128/2050_1 /TAXON_ID=160604 /ORGANISM="Amphidinium massartii, Strain CS-259" /LENGTH=768 /DNA_ID=CAMNT_0019993755 /DNA_START=87 /DNA_END=2390 /DNA_ORIENTATION=-